MKTLIQYTFFCVCSLAVFSCNNDFLAEDPDFSSYAETAIYIAPEWDESDYLVSCPNAMNNKFTVADAPEWLNVASKSGHFIGGVAYLTCSANRSSKFSGVGIYNALMTLDIEGLGKCAVPVAYVVEGNPVMDVPQKLVLSYNSFFSPFTIKNNGEGILIWQITEYPEWLSYSYPFQQTQGNVLSQNAFAQVYLEYIVDQVDVKNLSGKIVIMSNDKNKRRVEMEVSLDLGKPVFACDKADVNFGRTETTVPFEFSNQGEGLLVWKVEDCPEWLSLSKTSGTISSHSGININFACDRSQMPTNTNFVVITIKTNDEKNPTYPVTIRWRNAADSENIKAIEGTIKDAWLDKETDLLYLTTSQPNRLLAYDTKNRTIARELKFSSATNCFRVSEDGHKALVGHDGSISCIDLDNFSVMRTVEVNQIVYSVEWGSGDWCCYTPSTATQNCGLYWVNMVTGEKQETVSQVSNLYGGTIIKKIPNKNYIIASRLRLSPSGITTYGSDTKQFINYVHQSIGKFWFSTDGAYMFDSYRNVYRTSGLSTIYDFINNYPSVSTLKIDSYNEISWIDNNPATNSLWVSLANNYNPESPIIFKLSANDYTLEKTYYYDDYYQTTLNGVPGEYKLDIHYVFSNKQGTRLIAVRNVSGYYEAYNAWSLEFIPVEK
jgi:hypothetical protein